jgi:hypothetical protein
MAMACPLDPGNEAVDVSSIQPHAAALATLADDHGKVRLEPVLLWDLGKIGEVLRKLRLNLLAQS